MEVVRVDNDGNHSTAGLYRRIFPQYRATELHGLMGNRIPPLRDHVKRMTPIHVNAYVFLDAVKSCEDRFSLLEKALSFAARFESKRKWNHRAGADYHQADATKNDGEEPTPPERVLNGAGGLLGIEQNCHLFANVVSRRVRVMLSVVRTVCRAGITNSNCGRYTSPP